MSTLSPFLWARAGVPTDAFPRRPQLEETNEKVQPESELTERLKAADELEKTLKAEKKKGWKESRLSEEKLVVAIAKMDERIQISKTNMLDRDEGKEVSLGTSKINYIDPRLT